MLAFLFLPQSPMSLHPQEPSSLSCADNMEYLKLPKGGLALLAAASPRVNVLWGSFGPNPGRTSWWHFWRDLHLLLNFLTYVTRPIIYMQCNWTTFPPATSKFNFNLFFSFKLLPRLLCPIPAFHFKSSLWVSSLLKHSWESEMWLTTS